MKMVPLSFPLGRWLNSPKALSSFPRPHYWVVVEPTLESRLVSFYRLCRQPVGYTPWCFWSSGSSVLISCALEVGLLPGTTHLYFSFVPLFSYNMKRSCKLHSTFSLSAVLWDMVPWTEFLFCIFLSCFNFFYTPWILYHKISTWKQEPQSAMAELALEDERREGTSRPNQNPSQWEKAWNTWRLIIFAPSLTHWFLRSPVVCVSIGCCQAIL